MRSSSCGSCSSSLSQQTEARRSSLTWLEQQESQLASDRSSKELDPFPAPPEPPPPLMRKSSSRIRVGGNKTVRRHCSNTAAAGRARALRQAYVTLGVDRSISDAELHSLFGALLQKQSPENNPAECAGYYEKKTEELKEAYACVQLNRGGSSGASGVMAAPPPLMTRASTGNELGV